MAKKSKEKTKPSKKAKANPYKAGSRKAEIYDAFIEAGGGEAGLKAANKEAGVKGKKLIKPGTVKSWSSAWLKGEHTSKPKDPNAPKPVKAVKAVKDDGFHPDFKYTSRERADRAHQDLCERAGTRSHAFHVIEDDGRYAVVPSHVHPTTPAPTFKAGDIVYDIFIANSKAKVIEAGPQQSVIKYVRERPKGPREECVINRYLIKLPEKEARVKRERL